MTTKQKQGGGNRKHGRNQKDCTAYTAMGTRERNKQRKIRRHIKRNPKDTDAMNRLRAFFANKAATLAYLNEPLKPPMRVAA